MLSKRVVLACLQLGTCSGALEHLDAQYSIPRCNTIMPYPGIATQLTGCVAGCWQPECTWRSAEASRGLNFGSPEQTNWFHRSIQSLTGSPVCVLNEVSVHGLWQDVWHASACISLSEHCVRSPTDCRPQDLSLANALALLSALETPTTKGCML